MNSYLIHQRIRTPIGLHTELDCRGYRLCPIHQNLQGGFIIKKEVEAENFNDAYKSFASFLAPILDAASVVMQCAITGTRFSSFCIYKQNDNLQHLTYFYYADESDTVGMILRKQELMDIEKIVERIQQNESDRTALGYLRQANFSSGPMFFLAMLVIAVEALAGSEQAERKCQCGRVLKCECGVSTYQRTNRAEVENILGKELHDELYKKGRLRHKLLHGGAVNEVKVAEAAKQSYERILLEFLKENYQLDSIRKIADAPRNITFESTRFSVALEGRPDLLVGGLPDLIALEKNRKKLPTVDTPADY